MRIAFITFEYPPDTGLGGIGTYTYQMAKLLLSHNIDVQIFAGSYIRNNSSFEYGIRVHRIKCTDPVSFQKNVLYDFVRENKTQQFDLIESPEIHAGALEIKKIYPSIPLHVRLHASNHLVESLKKKYLPFKNKLRYFLGALKRGKLDLGYWRKYDPLKDADYLFTKDADFISAPTTQMKEWAVKNWSLKGDLINVIENPFVENNYFTNAKTDNAEKKIIFYGRLNVLKGLITATSSMKQILKKNPDWKWIIIGDDGMAADGNTSMRKWMKAELKTVKSQIDFHNSMALQDIPFYLKQASIVLIPSLFESYSYVTIEAMSAGKVVVGSDNTGIASLVENGKNGFLINPYEVKNWQRIIQKLISDIYLRKQVGNEAFEYVRNKAATNNSIVNFYKDLPLKN